jgi:hypothetical protein
MFKRKQSTATHWSAYDGREFCGTIDKFNDMFIARNPDGGIVGTFPSLRAAVQTLDVADDEILAIAGDRADRQKRG